MLLPLVLERNQKLRVWVELLNGGVTACRIQLPSPPVLVATTWRLLLPECAATVLRAEPLWLVP